MTDRLVIRPKLPLELKPRKPRRGMSRRQMLQTFAAAGLAGLASSLSPVLPYRKDEEDLDPLLPRIRAMQDHLHKLVRGPAIAVGTNALARRPEDPNHPQERHTYTVDVAQLMAYFAVAGDQEPYLALREFVVKNLIVNDKDHDFTRGFVLWRHNPGVPPDASGTTEALRVVRALWDGGKAFNRPEDTELALMVLDGYGRHYVVDKGSWMIRNYYNFGTRSFATNSFLIDYDPDLVQEIADAVEQSNPQRHQSYSEVATKSYEVMRKAIAPCGLLYDVLQPELKTMYFNVDVSYFSPNDIIQINNACTTAATVAKGDPAVGTGVLGFVLPRWDGLRLQYYGRTGETAPSVRIGGSEYAAVIRLAAALKHRAAMGRFCEKGLNYWERIVSRPDPYDAWQSSEVLLALQSVLLAAK